MYILPVMWKEWDVMVIMTKHACSCKRNDLYNRISPLLLTFLFWKVRLRRERPCRLMSRTAPEAGSYSCRLSKTHIPSLPGSAHRVFHPEFDLEKLDHFKLPHRLDSLGTCPKEPWKQLQIPNSWHHTLASFGGWMHATLKMLCIRGMLIKCVWEIAF